MSEPIEQTNASEHGEPEAPPPSRRRFLKFCTHGLGALFTALIAAPVVAYLIDPRNKKAAKADFRNVGKFTDLTIDVPEQRTIRDTRSDSWTLHPDDVIGRVWLVRKKKDAGETEKENEEALNVFSTICPHLGCSVNYEANDHLFKCPCHNGTFELDGEKKTGGAENPAPRGMDTLEFKIIDDPENPGKENRIVVVKYESFAQAIEEKKKRT